ncbi:MAG: hypothetical protein JO257_32395 [Deltaproteobacteria bacterium]|nr:hypothetical protein [Deltaproteobacteria bacterium]
MEITTRIRRDTLMELLETEAAPEEQRTTAPMPVVTLSDLLAVRDEQQPPTADPDTFEPPTMPRPHVRANGTDQALKALTVDPSVAVALTGALEALMSEPSPSHPSRLPTEPLGGAANADDEPAMIFDRAPTEKAEPRPRRARSCSEAFDLPPLNAREIATVLARLDEVGEMPVTNAAPAPAVACEPMVASEPAAVAPAPAPLHPALRLLAPTPSQPVLAPAVTALQLTSVTSPRLLVIAASCTVTLLLALLLTLL